MKQYCEHCGFRDELSEYASLKNVLEPLTLCEVCSYLPLARIKRREFDEEGNRLKRAYKSVKKEKASA